VQAAILAAALDGISAERDPGPCLEINMYTDGHTVTARELPHNLLDAVRALQGSAVFARALGDDFVRAYAHHKLADWQSYSGHLTGWERRTTLDC